MRLITEVFDNVVCKQILDEATQTKSHWIEGCFGQSNVNNRNKRFYSRAVLEGAVTPYMKLIEEKRALGELGHPAGPTINLERVSHLITKLEWAGDDLIGRAKVLGTPNGQIVKNFIDEGVKIGTSSRAMGSVKINKQGIQEVQNDMQLATFDIVADPSAPKAFVQGLYEQKEWIMVNGIWTEADANTARNMVLEARSGPDLVEAKVKAFKMFLEALNEDSYDKASRMIEKHGHTKALSIALAQGQKEIAEHIRASKNTNLPYSPKRPWGEHGGHR